MADIVPPPGAVGGKRGRLLEEEDEIGSPAAKAARVASDGHESDDDSVVEAVAPASGAGGEARVEVGAGAASRATRGGKKAKTLAGLAVVLPWVKTGPDAEAEFASKERMITCTTCHNKIKCETTLSNASKHSATASHIRAVKEAASQTKVDAVVTTTAASREARINVRVALTASAGAMVPKSLMGALYDDTHLAAAQLLRRHDLTIGGAGTVGRDFMAALDIHKKDIIAEVDGKIGCIIVDGATQAVLFDGTVHPLAVMFSSTRLGAPLALGYVTCDDGTAVQAADQIKALLATYGIAIDNIVALVGDNVTFNDVLATELNVQRMKCIPHSLALVVKSITSFFPAWEVFTVKLGATLHAGGGHKRRLGMAAKGIKPSSIAGYANRWCSTINVGKQLLDVTPVGGVDGVLPIAIVQEQVLSWTASSGDADVDGTTRLGQVRAAFHDDNINAGLLEVSLVVQLTGDIDRLITAAGGDTWSLKETPLAVFAAVNQRLVRISMAKDVDLDMAIDDAAEASPLEYVPEELAVLRANLRTCMRAAATAALKVFGKHVDPALEMITHRFMYDHHFEPPPMPASLPPTATERREFLRGFLGFTKDSIASDAMGEYVAYCNEWPSLPAADSTLAAAEFWHKKEAVWPTLSKIASWWCEMPTSSVAVERMFGIMRSFATPTRASMKEPTFQAEWLFRVNRRLVERRLALALSAAGVTY